MTEKNVKSGKQPLVQIVKWLSELEKNPKKHPYSSNLKPATKVPNNAFFLPDSKCCEVVEYTNHTDELNSQMHLCRVYCHTEALFLEP